MTKKPANKVTVVLLRDVTPDDLPTFFAFQRDHDANYMAAFTDQNPHDRDAYMARRTRFLHDDSILWKTILFDGQVAGSVVSFEQGGEREVSYWLGKRYWGKGIATRALALFLDLATERPLYARAAKDNLASLRVLQKCGFTVVGEGAGFANARGQEIEEYILQLAAPAGHDTL